MELLASEKTVLRRSAVGWFGGLITAVFIGVLTFGSAILAAVLITRGTFSLGFVSLALALWMFSLLTYLWRDWRARQSWMIEIDAGQMLLDLPPGRSLMTDSPREKSLLEVSDVLAIETRLESYCAFGFVNMQRSYGLRLKSGKLIVLGEDRALATDLADETVGRMIEEIALRTGLALQDRGMVEGKGGFMGVFFTSVPGWDAPSLPAGQQSGLWNRAGLTFGLAGIVAMAALILSLAF